ncbi:MAG: M20/M25/M40 family metallo-hydrolase [Paramuribaculum sp.]|nr:M20/M25/M40 family metallo-hydrolase [Paramuribaculum sp.]
MKGADEAIALLREMIRRPSPSRDEAATATLIYDWLTERGVDARRFYNNVWALGRNFDPQKPILMLNSHHDTVKPSAQYTRDPYDPELAGGKIYGLGSNDAGASVVSLIATYMELRDESLPFNLLLAVTAAEEVMGEFGMRAFLPEMERLGLKPDMVIVGEPTGMQPAVAERGLIVLDGVARGVAGHAARNEGVNALYRAIDDINRLRTFRFPKISDVLGPIKISITQIEAGRQHNVVPDECRYVVDVRTTDAYSNAETAEILQGVVEHSTVTPRSTRVHASVIPTDHPLVKATCELGREPFVSPTTSDMALMYDIPSLKIGPGESARSHTADEFVKVDEIKEAIGLYPRILRKIKL